MKKYISLFLAALMLLSLLAGCGRTLVMGTEPGRSFFGMPLACLPTIRTLLPTPTIIPSSRTSMRDSMI